MGCPICGSNNHNRIYRLCDNMKILGKVFPEKEAYVVSCKKCGLVYTDMEAGQEELDEYYKHYAVAPNYYEMFGKDATEEYYEHLLSILKPYISMDSRLLDVAGAWGEFAAYLSSTGYKNIAIVDPNEKCLLSAKEKCISAIDATSTNMAEYINEPFDMVILNHTLEHILDVKNTFENIEAVLKKDGYVFIEVPDAEEYVSEEGAPFNFLTYEHVLHLTQNDLINLAGIYGYEVCDKGKYYKKVSNYPSIYVVFKNTGDKHEIAYSDIGEKYVGEYIKKSTDTIGKYIEPLRKDDNDIILWGIGASTAILLEAFEGCNVKKLVDSNPNRQGLVFNIGGKKLTIESPDDVSDKDGTIVILSIPYFESIKKQIYGMGLRNRIVTLV